MSLTMTDKATCNFQNDPLPTVFTCLFCNHENSVTVKIDKKGGVGSLECKVCGQRFQCTINCTVTPVPDPGSTHKIWVMTDI